MTASFSDLLLSVRIRDARIATTHLLERGAVALAASNCAYFHLVIDGEVTLKTESADYRLLSGDFAALFRGSPHQIVDEGAGTTPTRIQFTGSDDEPLRICVGSGKPRALLLSGVLGFDYAGRARFGMRAPEVLLAEGIRNQGEVMVGGLVPRDQVRTMLSGSGASAFAASLVQLIYVRLLRDTMTPGFNAPATGLGALGLAEIDVVVRLVSGKLDAPWTVARLAAEIGMSRTDFAVKFTNTFGESPMAFVRRQRLQHAAQLLRQGDHSIINIATQVGYLSETAFSRAFRRQFQIAPKQFASTFPV